MSDSWVVQNLQNALNTWNEKLAEVWKLLIQSPKTFKGGSIWHVILNIHGGLQAIGLALLVLFFVVGVVKTRLFSIQPHRSWVSKVLQEEGLPDSNPMLNQRCRCSELPWVHDSGLTNPPCCFWMWSSPTERAASAMRSRSSLLTALIGEFESFIT